MNGWTFRDKILMSAGLLLTFASFVNSEVLGRTFHFEFLVVGMALCGISITQGWGKK